MHTLEEKKAAFRKNVGYICLNAASVVFNDNKDFPVEQIRLGSNVYSNKNKMANYIIEYSRNVQKAIAMARELKTIQDHGDHIDPFIIKYHPAWTVLREQNDFIIPLPHEEPCLKTPDFRTYEEWVQDEFLALGINVTLNPKINPAALINEKTLLEIYDVDTMQELVSANNQNHSDFYAFIKACKVKSFIDNYNKHIKAGGNPKELDCSYKGVRYTLGEDGFPLITIGSGKKTKKYDFRNPIALAQFYKKMADKNPHTEYGRTYKKMIQSRKF